jgi:hypothetical protein
MSADRHEFVGQPERDGFAFLHQARGIRDLDAAQVERIASRLRRPAAPPRRLLPWPVLAAVTLLLAGVGLAAAQGGLSQWPLVGKLFFSQPDPAPRSPIQEGETPEPRQEAARARDGLPGDAPPALARPGDAPGRPRGPEDAIVAESRAFAGIIESWRRQRDATMALGLLDAYERRHPAGVMRPEARVLRAEIYLAQGRPKAALSVLDAMALSGIPRARELQTVRGELRAKAGRCREARTDLVNVLKESRADDLAGRASRALDHCP